MTFFYHFQPCVHSHLDSQVLRPWPRRYPADSSDESADVRSDSEFYCAKAPSLCGGDGKRKLTANIISNYRLFNEPASGVLRLPEVYHKNQKGTQNDDDDEAAFERELR